MYVLTCGVCGMIDGADIGETYGQSHAFAPSYPDFPESGVVSAAPANVDHLLMAELDLDTLTRSRNLYDVAPLWDSVDSASIPEQMVDIALVRAGTAI